MEYDQDNRTLNSFLAYLFIIVPKGVVMEIVPDFCLENIYNNSLPCLAN